MNKDNFLEILKNLLYQSLLNLAQGGQKSTMFIYLDSRPQE